MYNCSDKLAAKIFSRIQKMDTGCWHWDRYTNASGYGIVHEDGVGNHLVHRAFYAWHRGAFPKNKFVLHKCDNRRCCNPEHLFLGTAQDNALDRDKKRRAFVKIDDALVVKIINLYKEGSTQTGIANAFCISQAQVSRIINRKQRKLVSQVR